MDTPASGATEAPDDGAIRRISDFVTDRPVAIAMVFIAAVVFGIFSYRRLPVTLMPELSYPTLTVRTEYPGAAPEEVENDVTRPLEEALGVIGGLRRISSVSRAGVSDVVLEFGWDIAMSDAIQDTLEKMDLVFLPTEAERPLILRFDPSLDPMMELSMSGDGVRYEGEQGLRRVRRIAELQVKRALEPVKGVAAVRIRGGLEEEINVNLSRDQLRRAGLAIDDVIRRLEQENINVAGGTLTEGRTEYMVRTLNEYTDLEQMADTIVTMREGRQVRIRDLGTVTWGHKERQITTRTDGRESVQLEIFKEADANIVALAERIRTRLGDFDPDTAEPAAEVPPRRGPPGRRNTAEGLAKELWTNEGLRIQVVADRSVFIASSVAEVRNTALYGGLLAILVLFLFLRQVRPTLIIAISIPISLLVTFAPLNLLGVSLNIMSLGGLALGIGMLVDSSIVVLESISRCREEGDDLRAAALRGTSEVRMAVIASTFTSIAVFAPMVFVHGVAGQAFGDLGLAVVISLLAALVVALLLIPMLASRGGFDLNEVILESALSTPFSIVNGLIKWASEVKKTAVDSPVIGWIVNRSVDVLLLLTLTVLVLLPIRSAMLAWRDFNQLGLRRSILLSPYIVIRTVIGFTLENLIACVLGTVACVIICWKFIVFPLLGVVLKVLLWAPSRIVDSVLSWSVSTYPALVLRVTQRPSGVLLMAGLCLAATVMLFRGLPSELLPEVHQGEFTFEVALPVGTPLEITDEVLSPVADAILAEREHIEALIVTLGFDPTTSQRSDEGEHSARFKVILDSADPATESLVVDRLRRRFVDLPDTNARVVRPVLFSFKTPIEVEVHGENLIELRRQAERVRSVMASLPELADVETTQRAGAPEVQIRYDRDQLARYDLNVSQVAARVRDSVKGSEATLYNLGDRRVPVMVRFREADRALVTQVSDFVVNPGADRPIPLSSVAEVDLAEGPAEVRRVDGRRVALVTANVAQGSLGGAVAAVENALNERVEWPADMTFFIAGQNQEWQQSQSSLMLALALSVFLVYVIMAMQFESLVQPFVIMLTIPLAFLGTGLALHALELSLSVVVFLGMIMLAGIVVNNAIVFIDYINTLRGRGMERDEAVVTAGSVRLRPILMTTATTVLGLLPMALGFGDGAELRAPMAVAVISGLVASTLLTLIIIPAVYVVFDRALDRFRASEPHPAEEPA